MGKSIRTDSDLDLENLRSFVREQVLPHANEWDGLEKFPRETVRQLHELGYLNAFIPVECGGMGATTLDLMCISRELAYGSRGLFCTLAGHLAALLPIVHHASPELRRRVLSGVIARPELGSFAFTEPDAGSDVLRIRATARRVSGGYRLHAAKCFITNVHEASHFIVMAKVEGIDDPRAAITAFYVPADSPGLKPGAPLSKLGFRDSDTGELFLDDVFVPEAHRLGGEGEGLAIAVRALQRSRTCFAGGSVGLCSRARDLLREFLGSRKHYGSPLLEQPQIRGLLAQLETEVRGVWLLGCEAAAAWEEETRSLVPSSMAKMYSGQVAMRYASAAVELFGAWGCTSEYEISRIYRDAKFFEIVEGPTFVQQVIIAKELFRVAGAHALRKAA